MNQANTYYVLSDELARNLDYSQLEDDSYDEARKSLDGTLVIVEHDGTATLTGGTSYTYEEALTLMASEAWWPLDDDI
jgi:hypothetical protein